MSDTASVEIYICDSIKLMLLNNLGSVKVCSLAQLGRQLFCIRIPLRVACIDYRFHCVAFLFGILHIWKAALWKMF